MNNADLVPMVSFSKVTELQREVVSTALEQRLLEKWKKASQASDGDDALEARYLLASPLPLPRSENRIMDHKSILNGFERWRK